jgi:hypothetical protein
MNRRLLHRSDVVCLCIVATILALSLVAGAQRTDGRSIEKPTLVADKISYLPDETIGFSGGNWKPGEGVTIVIKADSAGIVATVQGSADQNGRLDISTTMPKLPSFGSADTGGKQTPILTATATGSSGKSSTQFTLGHAPTDAERLISEEEFWNHRLTYPTGRFSPAWTRKAAEQDRLIKRGVPAGRKGVVKNFALAGPNATPTLNPTGFTALGPEPEHMTGCSGCFDYGTTEGRVNTIVTDPTTTTNGSIVAYLGNVGGGVWKTTNCCTASTTWTVTTDSPLLSTTSIDTLTLDPNNNNIVYAGTGDLNYGSFSMGSQGIFKSTDGGSTWTVLGASVFAPDYTEPTGNYPQYDSVGKVRVDPNNSNNIVAGSKKGLWFSYDQGATWANCLTNSFTSQRQDITGLELTDMGGGVTRILAAVGVRGFATYVQYDLSSNGANGIYKATMQASGCPAFTSIASNANGFVFGTQVTGSPYLTGALMNAGSGVPCNYPYITAGNATYCGNGATGGTTTNGGTVNNLGRIDIAVAPSDPNTIYAQVGSIDWNNNTNCGNTTGCQLGAWASNNGGATWTFMTGSAGGSLLGCASSGAGSSGNWDYPQNWYDQGIVVDPNNADRVFIDTFDIWMATRTGTQWYDVTCGYNGNPVANHVVHVDQHALAFVHGSSDLLLAGSDGGVFSTANASTAVLNTARPTWTNMDSGIYGIEFYSGDISGNFATSANPSAVGGAQDNGPSSVMFSGSPTGPAQWQMGLGGDGFSGLIDPMGTGSTQAVGTITLTTGGATAGQQFQIGSQVFTFVTSGTATGNVVLSSSTTTEGNNIVTSITRDIPTLVTAARSGSTVVVTAVTGGSSGNSIVFATLGTVSNFAMNGSGFLGGTTAGNDTGSLRYWEGNNSGGFSRCVNNCTQPGATWTNWAGSWTSDTQSFVLPVHIFRGGIPGGDDCAPAGQTTGCGHLLAGTTRVWETTTGTGTTRSWYVTNNPITANLTKATLGNRSYINQVKYSPKYQSVAIAGTNDGNVQIGFNLGTGTQAQATWVNVTGNNAVLPNRPIMGIALDPSSPAVGTPIGYAAVGGFNANTPTTLGHVFRVVCTMTATPCDGFTWTDVDGNLPDIPVDSVIVNPNYPSQVYVGTDFGLYYTDDVTANPPVWNRFNSGLPNVMVWDMTVDRGSTTLALWTRSRGAYAWPLPTGPESGPAGPATMSTPAASSTLAGTSVNFTWYPTTAAQAYWIDVGSAPGGNTYYQSGSLPTTTTSQAVTGLPSNGSTVYVTLYTLISGSWVSNAYTYTAVGGNASQGVITSPTPPGPFTGTSQIFTWSAGSGATAYWIDAGSTSGGNQYFQSGNIGNVLTKNVTGLPTNGTTVYVTLYSLVSGNWLGNFYTYTAFNASGGAGVLTTPNPGSTLTSSTVTFGWTAGAGASAYWLDLGSTPGGNQYSQSGNLGNVLTTTVSGLPTDGSTIYATLYSLVGGSWVANGYTYIASNGASGKGVITSPVNNASLTGNQVTFTWTPGASATAYWVDVSTVSVGGNDLDQSGNLGNVTGYTISNLPGGGATIYVRLYSFVGGQWLSNDYTYTSN